MLLRRRCRIAAGLHLHHFRDAEVEDLRVLAGGNKDVGRLDVAMHDSGGVGGGESVGDFDGQVQRQFQLKRLYLSCAGGGACLQGTP